MKNLAIALNAGSPEIRNAITSGLSDKNWAYWHWMDDFWVVQVPDNYTPQLLHNLIEAQPEVGKPTMLVFHFSGKIKYWGRNKKEAWTWLDHIGTSA